MNDKTYVTKTKQYTTVDEGIRGIQGLEAEGWAVKEVVPMPTSVIVIFFRFENPLRDNIVMNREPNIDEGFKIGGTD